MFQISLSNPHHICYPLISYDDNKSLTRLITREPIAPSSVTSRCNQYSMSLPSEPQNLLQKQLGRDGNATQIIELLGLQSKDSSNNSAYYQSHSGRLHFLISPPSHRYRKSGSQCYAPCPRKRPRTERSDNDFLPAKGSRMSQAWINALDVGGWRGHIFCVRIACTVSQTIIWSSIGLELTAQSHQRKYL